MVARPAAALYLIRPQVSSNVGRPLRPEAQHDRIPLPHIGFRRRGGRLATLIPQRLRSRLRAWPPTPPSTTPT